MAETKGKEIRDCLPGNKDTMGLAKASSPKSVYNQQDR